MQSIFFAKEEIELEVRLIYEIITFRDQPPALELNQRFGTSAYSTCLQLIYECFIVLWSSQRPFASV